MRSPILLLLLVCAFTGPSTVNAQRLFDLGVKGGVNLDDLSSSYNHSSIVGGHFGLFARVKPPILPGVQGELLLSSMGTSTNVAGVDVELRSVDLQVPVFAVFSLGPAELHAGGYYSRHFANTLIHEFDLDIEMPEVGIEELENGTYGVLFGVGLRLKRFYAGARYNHGLQSIGTGPYLGDVQNRQVQVYLGLGFFK